MAGVDCVIRNGRIIDSANNVNFIGDLVINNGVIQSVGIDFKEKALTEFDATGCLVTPGLIDCHVHCYEHATPLGINPDQCCLARGVTTVVDAGSSGESTFNGLRKFIAERSHARVLCFLHIAKQGLAAAGCAAGGKGGEIDSLNQIDVDSCVKCIQANRDMIVGVKLRISNTLADGGKNEEEAYRRSLEASRICDVPLMVHHTLSTVPTQSNGSHKLCCPREMRPGDLYTHTYHAYESTILDTKTRTILPDVLEARKRGVLFEVGHGQGSFNWTVAEACAQEQFWPDVIGSDMHSGNFEGPVYDLPTIMSKFLHLGMPIEEIIKATTESPAKAIRRHEKIGSLSPGNTADVTVLKIENVNIDLEDSQSQTRHVTNLFQPVAVWKGGRRFDITKPRSFPNPETKALNCSSWNDVLIKDPNPPKELKNEIK